MRKINSTFRTEFLSEAGENLNNRDYFAYVELDRYACYVLADSIDTDLDQNSAEMVVQSIIRSFTEVPSLSKNRLKAYVQQANQELNKKSQDFRLKASVTVVVTDYVKVRYLGVGNTRFYLLRNGRVLEQSQDQSLTANLVETEKIEKDKAEKHEERHNLYCYLGQPEPLTPFVSKKIKLTDGDTWLLLNKGIWENCDDGELLDASNEAKEPKEIIDQVEELILAKTPQELEEYTLAVTFVDKTYRNPKKRMSLKQILMIVIPIVIVILIVSIVLYSLHRQKVNNIAAMEEYLTSAKAYIQSENYPRANEDYVEAMKLARKLKKEPEKNTIDRHQRTIEQILLANELHKQGDYEQAINAYLAAKDLSEQADNIARDYIARRLFNTRAHLNVLDLIRQGDIALEYGKRDEAKAAYLQARTAANDIYFQEARKEAAEKLEKIQEAEGEEDKALQEEKRKQQEKEEEAKKEAKEKEQENLQKQLSALELTKLANTSYQIGSYEDAKMYYLMVKQIYDEIEEYALSNQTSEKILLIDKKMKEQTLLASRADRYVEDGNAKFEEGKWQEAKMLYLFAMDFYQQAQLESEIEKTQKKIEVIEEKIALINEMIG
jgi:serine/threonine protein phosphatase PrpC